MERWIADWYNRMPPVTKLYVTMACLTSVAVTFEFVTPFNLYLNWKLVREKYQFWRLLTTFLFFDRISVHLFFHMHFLYSYCKRLEEHFYHRRTADFLFLLLFGAGGILLITCWFDALFLSHSLATMVVYVWSRRFPDEFLSLFGLIPLSAPYLAYLLLAFAYLFNGWTAAAMDLMGIIVGHVFWYLQDIVPRIIDRKILQPPGFLLWFFPNQEVQIEDDHDQEEEHEHQD